jgi:MFS family permease
MASWLEPRTLLIGVFVLCFAFAEGVGTDWIAVAAIDGHGTSAAVGTLAFATFLAAMTTGRWFGPAALDRSGRTPVVRALAGVAIVGSTLYIVAPWTPLAFAGAALWGLGASLGLPVGMSAGADDPALAAARLSVVSSIGYCAFLAGPPLIGFIGNQVGVLRALAAVTVLLALAALIAPVVAKAGGDTAPPAGG